VISELIGKISARNMLPGIKQEENMIYVIEFLLKIMIGGKFLKDL
jgi:hypothetical protein